MISPTDQRLFTGFNSCRQNRQIFDLKIKYAQILRYAHIASINIERCLRTTKGERRKEKGERRKEMIPVGVGRGLLGSYARIVEQEIQDQKKRRMPSNHQIGKKGLIARFLLGIKF